VGVDSEQLGSRRVDPTNDKMSTNLTLVSVSRDPVNIRQQLP
jgi:hypothetical protein